MFCSFRKYISTKKIYIYAFYSGTLAHPTAGPDAAVTTQNSKRILAFKKIDSEEKKKSTSKHHNWLKPLSVNIWPVGV